jgi:hypothetical protein
MKINIPPSSEQILSKNFVKTHVAERVKTFIFNRVGTYVQRESKFCFVVVVVLADTYTNTALLSNFTMLSAYCTIASGSLARQPCPAALPGSLARQPCPAALPGSLARQPCPAALQKYYKFNNSSRIASLFTACSITYGRQFSSSFHRNLI